MLTFHRIRGRDSKGSTLRHLFGTVCIRPLQRRQATTSGALQEDVEDVLANDLYFRTVRNSPRETNPSSRTER
jgi:hypothetical protein